MNLYRYVGNNPGRFIDPLGLQEGVPEEDIGPEEEDPFDPPGLEEPPEEDPNGEGQSAALPPPEEEPPGGPGIGPPHGGPRSKRHVHYEDGTSHNDDGTSHDAGRGIPAPNREIRDYLKKHGWDTHNFWKNFHGEKMIFYGYPIDQDLSKPLELEELSFVGTIDELKSLRKFLDIAIKKLYENTKFDHMHLKDEMKTSGTDFIITYPQT